ncbi:MAG: hypothetical protein AAF063_16855 [Cyanobacteria bacterium J06643_5]
MSWLGGEVSSNFYEIIIKIFRTHHTISPVFCLYAPREVKTF